MQDPVTTVGQATLVTLCAFVSFVVHPFKLAGKEMQLTTTYALLWFPLVLVAIVNGLIRQELIIPLTGDLAGHQLSTVTFLLLLFGYTWLVMRRWLVPTSKQAWRIGALWFVMTVIFEFGFGHYVMGHPWQRLLADYNLLEGRLWVVVLAATCVAPAVIRKMRTKSAGGD